MNREKFLRDLPNLSGMTLEQFSRFYGEKSESDRRWLRSLESKGLITMFNERVRERDVSCAISVIRPGERAPSAGHIAYEAERRWSDTLDTKLIIRATTKLATLFGGELRHVVAANWSHELSLAEVLLSKRRQDPHFEWRLVSAKPGTGALPDAVSVSGQILIELVGRYNRDMVSAKLDLAANATLELW